MKAVHLKTEYLTAPLGIDIVRPRFYWNCEDGKKQTAYRIIVKRNGEEVWDSKEVASSSMTHIRYEGKPLCSRDHLVWSVRLRDENNVWGEESTSWFEMGLLGADDWKADWISGAYQPKKNVHYPVDCFRKEFRLKADICSARLYAAAKGVYDLTVNGTRIEDVILAPGITDYRKRIQYQTYDVTGLLLPDGINKLELRTADGWYRGSVAAYGVMNAYGIQTSVIGQLEVSYQDGSREIIGTDGNFAWSNDGPIRFADLKDGEVYDARRKPSYSGKAVVVKEKKPVPLAASNNVAVKEQERFSATLLQNKNAMVFDFGQNIAGYVEFSVKGKKGQKFTLVCGEVLTSDGHVDLSGVQESRPAKGWEQVSLIKKLLGKEIKGEAAYTPLQEIRFTCSGKEDFYKTSFAVFGFRYAELVSEEKLLPEHMTAIAVYSAMEQTGSFTCSNELVNRLYQNALWSMKGNFLDIPTDCPTRERLGWTGDAQIFFDTGSYMMDTAAFFRKWLRDMEDAQYKNGLLPFEGVEMMYKATGSSVGWADAVYLIPYRYYKRYGDKELLKQAYPMMKRYTDYLIKHLGMKDKKEAKANPYNAYTYEKGVHLGEWLEPEEFRDKVYGAQAKHPEECTAYLYLAMSTMAAISNLLQEFTGEESYQTYAHTCRKYADGAKKAYDALFVKTGKLHTMRQAKLVRPLALGLLDGKEKEEAQELLLQAVEKYRFRVGTGFLSTPFLLPVLTEAGKVDMAYKMLENTEKPGWLAEVLDGATTVWENWEGNLSQNHYSPGAVCQWLFDTVGGIRVAGENYFTIQPHPGGTLTYAKVSYQSLYGEVASAWKKEEDGKIAYTISVPLGTTAAVILPDGTKQILEGGLHCLRMER